MTFRTHVRKLCDERDWSLRDLTDRVNLSRTTVNRWYYNAGEIGRADATVIFEFMRVFETTKVTDIVHDIIYDSLSDEPLDPTAD